MSELDNQPLFDIPETLSPRLRWMREHDVQTHYAEHLESEGDPWMAISMVKARDLLKGYELTDQEKTDLVAMMAGYCRLLDDAVIIGYGRTEEDAVVHMAQLNELRLWNEEGAK